MNVGYYVGHSWSIHTGRAMLSQLSYLFWHQNTIMTGLQLMLYTTGICKRPQSQVITFYVTLISRYNHDTNFIRDFGRSATHQLCLCTGFQRSHKRRSMGLLQDTYNYGLRMRREWREHFPRHRWLPIPTCIKARALGPAKIHWPALRLSFHPQHMQFCIPYTSGRHCLYWHK